MYEGRVTICVSMRSFQIDPIHTMADCIGARVIWYTSLETRKLEKIKQPKYASFTSKTCTSCDACCSFFSLGTRAHTVARRRYLVLAICFSFRRTTPFLFCSKIVQSVYWLLVAAPISLRSHETHWQWSRCALNDIEKASGIDQVKVK